MDENRFEGAARDLGGQAKELAGRVTGDEKLRVEGHADQAAGTAQRMYGQVRDAVRDYGGEGAEELLDRIEAAGDALAEQVDKRPITSLLIAAGVGFLIALATKPAPDVVYRRA